MKPNFEKVDTCLILPHGRIHFELLLLVLKISSLYNQGIYGTIMALKKLEPNIKYVRVLVQEDKDCTFQEFSCCFHASHPMFISNAQLRKRKVGGWKDVKDVNIRSVFLYRNEHKVQSTKEFKEHVVVQ
ncbi:hypothetical protein BATDEDRAFT_28053 [Batrachochytrium dendrobatidis JAM81]|uniref:Uncharacterized protein n=1 Tax=Batrachochytrium dendrobatidis (strain JAM81 / FGSC 10211) TaxID=684364 RepID=F4PCP3_BATDJ|nr:uncharacterized protein BATDEDRAFT_28053 [Batrachochytrium dendrobatidis JAM81]EGF76863.1 hypothetical protein BATDEDRAFT_28053 [Batrachochytrium dendrobatidis JAM81]|eukprot:XP_006682393.1 hypothetical protein BATDEDRAFT_28053 [Batrachochytrium dendrobatidis JAM81]